MRAELPKEIADELKSPKFEKLCMESFDALDVDGDGSLDKEELAPVLLDMIGGLVGGNGNDLLKLTTQDCLDFVDMVFDQDGDGRIDRQEFFFLVEYAAATSALQQQRFENTTPSSSQVTLEMRHTSYALADRRIA